MKYGIYVHIPFCVKKCDYCDFLSFSSDESVIRQYIDAVIKEIKAEEFLEKTTEVDTIFFGGGTPSLIKSEYICEVLQALRDSFSIQEGAEITIEANPGTLDGDKLAVYREIGINRVSMGVQSFVDKELRLLGRIHDRNQAVKSYELIRNYGFDNINIDLISHLPGQSIAEVNENLSYIKSLEPEHVSVYNLIVEPDTPFFEKYGNESGQKLLPNENLSEAIDIAYWEELRSLGYNRYEISNFSKDNCECAHNLGYWERKPYRGYGLGAASLIKNMGEYRFSAERRMQDYLEAAEKRLRDRNNAEEPLNKLTVSEAMEEFMFLGLRKVEGVKSQEFLLAFDQNIMDVYGGIIDKYTRLNLMIRDDEGVRLNNKGLTLSNIILSDFLLD